MKHSYLTQRGSSGCTFVPSPAPHPSPHQAGGYGVLGVCTDSVASVQQALTGACTLFPLVLGGAAKVCVGGGAPMTRWTAMLRTAVQRPNRARKPPRFFRLACAVA